MYAEKFQLKRKDDETSPQEADSEEDLPKDNNYNPKHRLDSILDS